DGEEVIFRDLIDGTRKNKAGYNKIQFCGQQAECDGLRYFWVDTCYIDKTDKAEFSHAIQSMFRWYRNATRCYIYLSDVSTSSLGNNEGPDMLQWESAFQNSEWFLRGWTLQELPAPGTVEFFSREQYKLGDKVLLKAQIHKATRIPYASTGLTISTTRLQTP
ncbi:heterokaryon incompatibility protein-domain-containing protein, partial [Phaeosphaeriaceae sp. PMI808]